MQPRAVDKLQPLTPPKSKTPVNLAKTADVAIVCVGTTTDVEAEGRDRTTLGLPGNQQQLVEAVLTANPKTIVVEMNAGPLAVPTIADNAPAMIEAWWAGEEGGNAIADVLFGNVNPGGKLPLTVYASADQVPPQDEYDVTKGFTYMYIKGNPLRLRPRPLLHNSNTTTSNWPTKRFPHREPLRQHSTSRTRATAPVTKWCSFTSTSRIPQSSVPPRNSGPSSESPWLLVRKRPSH